VLLLQRLGVVLTKFNKKKVDTRHSLLAKDGLQGSSNSRKFFAKKISGESASSDIKATRAFTAEFKKIIEDHDFPSHVVFNE
jgi:hypothetical protein